MSDPERGGDTLSTMAAARARMVDEQLIRRGIRDRRVLEVMGRVERHRFVPESQLGNAYGDHPVPIGAEQTLSQPYIVALMTESLTLEGKEKVLEIGTGSGYQTAVLAELAGEVYTVELIPELSEAARERLLAAGYRNVHFLIGDGREGWAEEAPFDAILAAAAPLSVPPRLLEQLSPSGRLVLPVGPANDQELELYIRDETASNGFRIQKLGAVRFVPLI